MHLCPEPRACAGALRTIQVRAPAGTRRSTALMAGPVAVV